MNIEVYQKIDGETRRVMIDIDEEKLVRIMGRRALRAKARKSTLLYGSITVTVV